MTAPREGFPLWLAVALLVFDVLLLLLLAVVAGGPLWVFVAGPAVAAVTWWGLGADEEDAR